MKKKGRIILRLIIFSSVARVLIAMLVSYLASVNFHPSTFANLSELRRATRGVVLRNEGVISNNFSHYSFATFNIKKNFAA